MTASARFRNLMYSFALVVFALAAPVSAWADEAAAAPAAAPDLATRVADLEAYINNGAPKALDTRPGPGHNAWMMTSAALVLFMTLPGSGAVLRRPRAPQERALRAGAVLRHAPGWSPSCGGPSATASPSRPGSPFLGGSKFAMLKGVTLGAQRRLRRLGLAERLLDVPADVRHHHARPHRRAPSPSA